MSRKITFLIGVVHRWQAWYHNNELHRQNKYDRDILFTIEEHNNTNSNGSNSILKCAFIRKNNSWIKTFTPECSFSIACLAWVRCDYAVITWACLTLGWWCGTFQNYFQRGEESFTTKSRLHKTPFARAFERRTTWKLARADEAKIHAFHFYFCLVPLEWDSVNFCRSLRVKA